MKYENASDILPENLLQEIKRYAAGKLLYIPTGDEKKTWGEATGYREKLIKRNLMICNKYAHGMTVSELADDYYLSLDSIKKIIYSKKIDKNLSYEPTVISAVQYVNAGMLEEWVQSYLLFTCKDAFLLNEISRDDLIYFGVVKLPLRLIQSSGHDYNDTHKIHDNSKLSNDPPLIINFEAGKLYCEAQRDLLNRLKQQKINVYPSIIILKGNSEYKDFMKHFGTVLFYVDRYGK